MKRNGNKNRMRIMKYIIDVKKSMNIRWINYLCHLLNLLLLCGYTSSSSSVNSSNNNNNIKSNNVLLLQSTMSIVQQNKSTLTSISNDISSSVDFMTSKNFTTMPFSNRNREMDSNNMIVVGDNLRKDFNQNKNNIKSDISSTYQISNFNESNKSEKNSLSVNVETRQIVKRGGPKRVKNLLNMTKVNTSDITANNDEFKSFVRDDISYYDSIINQPNLFSRVSRAPQNAKRKKLKSVIANSVDTDVTKPIKVSLLGLFELTSRAGLRMEGKSELAAAELAVRHINERGLLEGYTLELMTNDTQVMNVTVIKQLLLIIFCCKFFFEF